MTQIVVKYSARLLVSAALRSMVRSFESSCRPKPQR